MPKYCSCDKNQPFNLFRVEVHLFWMLVTGNDIIIEHQSKGPINSSEQSDNNANKAATWKCGKVIIGVPTDPAFEFEIYI